MKKIFENIHGPIETLGSSARSLMDKSLEGAVDLFGSSFKLGNELLFGGSQKTVKVFMLLFAHRETVAEHFYPTKELREYSSLEPDNDFLKYDLYRAEKNKKRFYKRLSIALSLLPHQKYMTQKFLEQNQGIEEVRESVAMAELLTFYEKLAKILDALESDKDILDRKKELRYFIRLKIELGRMDCIEEYLDVAQLAGIEDVKVLRALAAKSIGDFDLAATLLSEAAGDGGCPALEELALLLDEISSEGKLSKEQEKISQLHFEAWLGTRHMGKLKSLPLNFFVLKRKQLEELFSIPKNGNN